MTENGMEQSCVEKFHHLPFAHSTALSSVIYQRAFFHFELSFFRPVNKIAQSLDYALYAR
jgi:hypothetical protein